jgi:LysM repeat protein
MIARNAVTIWAARLLMVILVLSMSAATVPEVAVAAPAAKSKCGTPYIVKQGDTLANIGKKYDVSSYTIVNENNLKSPYTIYVGQKLCMPENNKSGSLAGKYANAQAAYFTAYFWAGGINVQPYNYPKTTVFVKVDNAGDRSKNFIKIGRLNTKNTGNNRVHYDLPTDLKSAKSLWVCLKNLTTDYNQCVLIPPK